MTKLGSIYYCRLVWAVLLCGGCSGEKEPRQFREFWEASYLGGQKIGHVQTTYFHDTLDGEEVIKVVTDGPISLVRGTQRIEQHVQMASWETEAGVVRRFTSAIKMQNSVQSTAVVVRGEEAVVTSTVADKETSQTIPWPRGTLSPFGQLDDLKNKPVAPGQTRQVVAFLPLFNCTAPVTLAGKPLESTELTPGVYRDLQRVEMQARPAAGPPFDMTIWIDDAGEVLKSEVPGIGITSVRTTREIALADDGRPPADIDAASLVAVSPALVKPFETTAVRYRLSLAGGDAAATFPSCEYQTVRRLDDGSAEAIVTAFRPESSLPTGFVPTAPTERDRWPSSLVQSDDAVVVQMAAQGAGDVTDPWQVALRLEAFVRARMKPAKFSPAFAGAAETARALTGDCTEHAVLLCALLRARGIPSRAALGLVYVEHKQAFGYHLWTEAFINGRWVPLDATIGRGGTSASYLKIGQADLAGVDAYAALLPVISIIGKLKVDVLEQR